MNGSYYKTPVFLNDIERDSNMPNNYQTDYPMEQSYIENIIRNNIGKKVREHAGRDNLVLNDVENNKHYLILMIYVDFFEFDEEIIYAK